MGKKNKKEYNRRCIGGIFGIAVIAAATGFAAGLLFAPRSGAKTRNMLNSALVELLDRFKYLMLEARVMSEELVEKSKEKAEKISSKVKIKK